MVGHHERLSIVPPSRNFIIFVFRRIIYCEYDAKMSPSAAMALRDSFGDRKMPDISRKITACVLCRKLKVNAQCWGSITKLTIAVTR